MTYPENIPRWRVDAALKLLGLWETAREVTIGRERDQVKVGLTGFVEIDVTPNSPTSDVVVLGIDPSNGDAREQTVSEFEALVFTGSGMYVDGVTHHGNGTKVATVKRKQ